MPLTVCTDPVSERGLTHADSARHRDNRSRIIHNLPGRLVAKLRREVLFSAGHLQPPLPDGPYWRSAVRKARGSPAGGGERGVDQLVDRAGADYLAAGAEGALEEVREERPGGALVV